MGPKKHDQSYAKGPSADAAYGKVGRDGATRCSLAEVQKQTDGTYKCRACGKVMPPGWEHLLSKAERDHVDAAPRDIAVRLHPSEGGPVPLRYNEMVKDSAWLATYATSLSYSGADTEAITKHRLNEIAMRLSTNYYQRGA